MGASTSREKFRESVSALVEVEVSADDADFWDELWKIPNSGEEVFELFSQHRNVISKSAKFGCLAQTIVDFPDVNLINYDKQ